MVHLKRTKNGIRGGELEVDGDLRILLDNGGRVLDEKGEIVGVDHDLSGEHRVRIASLEEGSSFLFVPGG